MGSQWRSGSPTQVYNISSAFVQVGLMQGTLHLPISSHCEPLWSHLIKACMEPDPSLRPSFRQLASHIGTILKHLGSSQEGVQAEYRGQTSYRLHAAG